MKEQRVSIWARALGVCVGLLSMTAQARVTIDAASQERMAQELMGKVSGLRDMQEHLALAQHDINMLQDRLAVMKMQAERLKSDQLNSLIRTAEAELGAKVARSAAIAAESGVAKSQPYFEYASNRLRDASPLLNGFADRVGEFSPVQMAEKEISMRSAEASVSSTKRDFLSNMQQVHESLAGVIEKSLDTGTAVEAYFNGYLAYAKGKDFVTDDQRDELWSLLSWFMLDYLSDDPPAGQRDITATIRRVRRREGDSFDELMKHVPAAYRFTESELPRPHSDWHVLLEDSIKNDRNASSDDDKTAVTKCAFVLMQVAMWSTTLLLANKAVAAQKDIELDGALQDVRTKLVEMGVDQSDVDAARSVTEVQKLVADRTREAGADEDISELTSLSIRVHQVAYEFQNATSNVTAGEREVREAARRGDLPTRSMPASMRTSGAASGSGAGMSEDFPDDEEEMVDDREKESGGWLKTALLITGVVIAAAKFYSKAVEKEWLGLKNEGKHETIKKTIDKLMYPLDFIGKQAKGIIKDKASVVTSFPLVGGIAKRVQGWWNKKSEGDIGANTV